MASDGTNDPNAGADVQTADTTESTGQVSDGSEQLQDGASDAVQDDQTQDEGQAEGADDPEIDIGGEKFRSSEVRSWKDSHGKITQELQTVARMRKDMEPAIEITRAIRGNQALANAVVSLIERGGKNPAVLERVAAAITGQTPLASSQSQNPLEQKLASFEQRLAAYEDARLRTDADMKIAQEYSDLRNSEPSLKQMGDAEWKGVQAAIADHAASLLQQGFNVPLRYAYDHLSKNGAIATALKVGEALGQKSAAKKAATPAPKVKGGAGGKGAPAPKGPMSPQEEEEYLARFAERVQSQWR